MSRLDELIYHLDTMQTQMQHGIGTNEQQVMGKDRLCCVMCGYCPEAIADWLREIRDEVRANASPKSKLAKKANKNPQKGGDV